MGKASHGSIAVDGHGVADGLRLSGDCQQVQCSGSQVRVDLVGCPRVVWAITEGTTEFRTAAATPGSGRFRLRTDWFAAIKCGIGSVLIDRFQAKAGVFPPPEAGVTIGAGTLQRASMGQEA